MKKKLINSGITLSLIIGIGIYSNKNNLVQANGDYTCTFDISTMKYKRKDSTTYDVEVNDGKQETNWVKNYTTECGEGAFSSWDKILHKGVYVGTRSVEIKGYTYGNTRTGCDGKSWKGVNKQDLNTVATYEEICSYEITDEIAPTTNTSYQNQ